MNDHEAETELDAIVRVLDHNGVLDGDHHIALQIRSALIERKIRQLKREAVSLADALRPTNKVCGLTNPEPMFVAHPFDGQPGIIGGNCRACSGPVVEPWHRRPHADIGQPCSGWVCDGHHDLCPDCDDSYRDHRESMGHY